MKLSDLLQNVTVLEIKGPADLEILMLASESGKVENGALFAAVKGTHADGHDFIQAALEKGARAILCEKFPDYLDASVTYIRTEHSHRSLGFIADAFYGHPSSKLKLVGVTGTNGKTTVATVLYQLFDSMGHFAGLISTVENIIHTEKLPATQTTPDLIELHRLMADMVFKGVTHAFMEVSSHAIDQDRISGLSFTGAIFTNLTHDHLDYHKTFDAYRLAKKKFFDNLPETAFALINKDDKEGMGMLSDTRAKKYTYGAVSADFVATIMAMDIEKMKLAIDGAEQSFELVGRFNMYNLLAVYGTAVLLGEDKQKILKYLSVQKGALGRFQKIHSKGGITALVDYAHTPDAITNVLQTIQEVKEKTSRIITVIGCGGDRDKTKRPFMALAAVSLSDHSFFTSDNPRSEDPDVILSDMTSGLAPDDIKKVTVLPDRTQAIAAALGNAKPGDIVLIAGKGHEEYQEIKGVKHTFSDQGIVQNTFTLLGV
jgi:UDP-N-acetylmuramoyl-L-alanyl-D-glutamate--2,6-diaminopimelate ligase